MVKRFSRLFLSALLTLPLISLGSGGVGMAHASGPVLTVEPDKAATRTVSGTVVPYREVTLTAQSAGRVVQVAGAEGDRFEQDSVLVSISDDRLRAQRQAAQAEMRTTEAAIREAQMQYGREVVSPQSRSIGQMPGMGIPSMFDQMFTQPAGQMMGMGDPALDRRTDLYSRYIGVDQAQARWEQARARVAELDAAIRDTRSEAPFDGLVMHKHVEEGDTVQPGQPLLTFGHVEYLRVEAQVPVRLVAGLQEDDYVHVRLDTGDEVEARVAQIFPLADPQRHTVTVKFDLPQGVRGGPGMHAAVHLPQGEASGNRVVIPRSALIPGGALPRVAVLDGEGHVRVRMVRLGGSRGDQVVVTSGLEPGMQILARPGAGVRSGQPVGSRAPDSGGSADPWSRM
ncbi:MULTISPECIES: efflux RND transporter periplasmic adaptor subunit [unclassified Thioalkalivibrio]|uniref:efflux RND transporter periplasmic adaptor subunit n=1 Tax=unclassified Thioalkalivibrio TaxID=2621013 RepID=UPI00047815CF|nr:MULTISPECIES: efflux RND transporter periplasmic adaptor subunit [unclassified Thioalkalivibrio]